jgi:hypothetical protein
MLQHAERTTRIVVKWRRFRNQNDIQPLRLLNSGPSE